MVERTVRIWLGIRIWRLRAHWFLMMDALMKSMLVGFIWSILDMNHLSDLCNIGDNAKKKRSIDSEIDAILDQISDGRDSDTWHVELDERHALFVVKSHNGIHYFFNHRLYDGFELLKKMAEFPEVAARLAKPNI